MTLDVSMNDSQMMHILENYSSISCNSDSLLCTQVNLVFFHMEHIVKTSLADMLEHNVKIGDFRDDTHEDGDIRVSQDALHNNFVLDLLKEFICESWVEDFFDGNGGSIEFAFMDN